MLNENLIEAAKEGDLSGVQNAIKNGADIECQDELKKTPLENAAENGHLKIVKYLIEKNANVEACNECPSKPPLCAAASNNHLDIVKYLVEKKTNIEAKDEFSRSPLHFAASGCHLEVVKYLVQNGANVNAKDDLDENSPLHYVAFHHEVMPGNIFFDNLMVDV
jgi:ankyrin repeat protein